jgi:hypothetical protein
MLNKALGKVAIVLILAIGATSCGKNDPPTGNQRDSYSNVSEKKAFSSDKWAEFQQGFKKKTTVAQSIRNGRVKIQMDSIEKEYNIRKTPLSSRIDPTKWREFQIAFTTRAKLYINNISSAFD